MSNQKNGVNQSNGVNNFLTANPWLGTINGPDGLAIRTEICRADLQRRSAGYYEQYEAPHLRGTDNGDALGRNVGQPVRYQAVHPSDPVPWHEPGKFLPYLK